MADIRIEDRRIAMGGEFNFVLFKPQSEEALQFLKLSSAGAFWWVGSKSVSGEVLAVERRIASGFAEILADDNELSLEYEDDQKNEE